MIQGREHREVMWPVSARRRFQALQMASAVDGLDGVLGEHAVVAQAFDLGAPRIDRVLCAMLHRPD
jgi:hypothetical protein